MRPAKKMTGLMRIILLVLVLPGLFLCCGYSSAPLYRYDSQSTAVSIPMFENRTNWRHLEVDVTENVIRTVTARTPFQLVDHDRADIVVHGEIVDVSRPVLAEDDLDSVIRSSARYRVNVKITDRSTNEVLQEATDSFSASFAQARGKTETAARKEVEHEIGTWVVGLLQQKAW